MRPFILTELQAGKPPRGGLLLLCALYALPGFVGRAPWRIDDAAGFGVALTMARGGLADWLMPNVFGEPIPGDGPLPFWLSALVIRVFRFAPEHATMRLVALVGLALLWSLFWYATYNLARRPGMQPSDPFGASASRVDFGRAIADSALLLMLATLGLLVRLHETTAGAAQVTFVGLYLFGAAYALDFPRRGGTLAGLGIAALALTTGWPPALALLAALALLTFVSDPYRLIRTPVLAAALPAALLPAALWPLALAAGGAESQQWLAGWLATNAASVGGPSLRNLDYLVRTLPWFFWPAWPIALWGLFAWRGRLREPAVALPLVSLCTLFVVTLLAPDGNEYLLLPLAPPLVMLAAVGLPMLRRAVVSLIDWFAVMTFTLIGVVTWAYWIAYISGYPPTMAYKASLLAPGFKPEWILDEIVLGVLATAAWLLLVRWRVSRQPPMIWRAVVLASGGLVLAWFLLMTLWLPVFDERNTYRVIAAGARQNLPDDYDCIATRSLGLAERTSLAYFAHLRFGAGDAQQTGCDWLLIEDNGPLSRVIGPQEEGWTLVWQGRRRADPDERFRLYRRAAPGPAAR